MKLFETVKNNVTAIDVVSMAGFKPISLLYNSLK